MEIHKCTRQAAKALGELRVKSSLINPVKMQSAIDMGVISDEFINLVSTLCSELNFIERLKEDENFVAPPTASDDVMNCATFMRHLYRLKTEYQRALLVQELCHDLKVGRSQLKSEGIHKEVPSMYFTMAIEYHTDTQSSQTLDLAEVQAAGGMKKLEIQDKENYTSWAEDLPSNDSQQGSSKGRGGRVCGGGGQGNGSCSSSYDHSSANMSVDNSSQATNNTSASRGAIKKTVPSSGYGSQEATAGNRRRSVDKPGGSIAQSGRSDSGDDYYNWRESTRQDNWRESTQQDNWRESTQPRD